MREPRKLKVGFKEYDIIRKETVVETPDECYGKINYQTQQIEIATKYSKNQRNVTFLHEMIHAIFDKLDMHELRTDEVVVNQLATELYMVFIENPEIFKMTDI